VVGEVHERMGERGAEERRLSLFLVCFFARVAKERNILPSSDRLGSSVRMEGSMAMALAMMRAGLLASRPSLVLIGEIGELKCLPIVGWD
jgi:hypothetical protein